MIKSGETMHKLGPVPRRLELETANRGCQLPHVLRRVGRAQRNSQPGRPPRHGGVAYRWNINPGFQELRRRSHRLLCGAQHKRYNRGWDFQIWPAQSGLELRYPLFQPEAELLSLRTSHEFERRGGGGGGGWNRSG